jgi:hypothetical protein
VLFSAFRCTIENKSFEMVEVAPKKIVEVDDYLGNFAGIPYNTG